MSSAPPKDFQQLYLTSALSGQPVSQQLFFKQHSLKGKTVPNQLFLLNIPMEFMLQKSLFKNLFQTYGTVESVKINMKTKSAHLVFEDAESVEEIVREMAESSIDLVQFLHDASYKAFKRFTNRIPIEPDISLLKEKVDLSMNLFAEGENRRKKEEEAMRGVPDEDGFITVQRTGVVKTGSEKVQVIKKEVADAIKPKDHGLTDFYRFQFRERKRNELADLRRRFEEDKEKIKSIKESRKFKPY